MLCTFLDRVIKGHSFVISMSSFLIVCHTRRSFVLHFIQDQLSADLYNFASKEGDYARYYVMVSAPQFTVNGNANMERSTVTQLLGDV